MSVSLDSVALDKLRELDTSEAHPGAVAALRRILTEGSDLDAYKINPFRVATDAGIPRHEVVRAFLFATRLGLVDMNFDIHCPSCSGIPAYHKHLMGLANSAHCDLCAIDWDLDLERQVEVTWTANPAVRKLDYADWADRDFNGKMKYLDDLLLREGRNFAGCCIYPGETITLEWDYEPGEYRYYVPSVMEKGGTLVVSKERDAHDQVVEVVVAADGTVSVPKLALKSGRILFAVTSNYPSFNGFLVRPTAMPRHWVSAAYLLAAQDFRDLFSAECLAPDVSFAIRNVTLMFTDIKGSTKMYERLGDAKAFSVVSDHFRIMADIVRSREGGIVKTIGDAVMASFPRNANAFHAAVEIQRALARESERLGGLEVKIGLHRGGTIAVTNHRLLDYFGQTVNLAARIQGEARAREVLMSAAVAADPAIKTALADAVLENPSLAPTHREANLAGVSERQTLTAVRI